MRINQYSVSARQRSSGGTVEERPRALLIFPNRERGLAHLYVTLPRAVCALSPNARLSDGVKRLPPKDSIIYSTVGQA
jgi:hypothetical protein